MGLSRLSKLLLLSGLLYGLGSGSSFAAAADDGETTAPESASAPPSSLEQQVADLTKRVLGLETSPASGRAYDPHFARREATHTTRKGYWAIPETEFELKLGGFVKLDAIHDFQNVGNRNKFQTRTIPVPTNDRSTTQFQAFESRLNVDVRGPVQGHDMRAFIEGDFFGSGGGTFELRHAFGEIGGLLAGQTWSTYMDLSSRPHTLDFEGPDAEIFIRQAMIRWTQPVGERVKFQLALESSDQDISVVGGATGSAKTTLPDLTGNVRLTCDTGHVQLSGVARYLEFDGTGATPGDEALGWGIALSGLVQLGDPSRRLMGQVSFGRGSAQYNQAMRGSGSDAVLKANGVLKPLPLVTTVVGYEHDWTASWTSTFAYAFAQIDNIRAQPAGALHESQSFSSNLVWHPYERFLTGVEYLFGIREDNGGADGSAHRLQVSFKFVL